MLAFMKVLQPKTVEEAYELATKNKTAPMLAGGCWLRLGRRTWPAVIDMASLDLRYVREENNEFVIGASWHSIPQHCYYGWICSKPLWLLRHYSCINGSTCRHRYF